MPENNEQKKEDGILIRVIENGVLVRCGIGWMYYPNWERASEGVGDRIDAIKKKRQEKPR